MVEARCISATWYASNHGTFRRTACRDEHKIDCYANCVSGRPASVPCCSHVVCVPSLRECRELKMTRLLAMTSLAAGLVMMPFSSSAPQSAVNSAMLHRPSFDASATLMEAFGPVADVANLDVQRMLRHDHRSWAHSPSSHRVLRSALIGFGIGAVVGFTLVGIRYSPGRDQEGPFGGAGFLQLAAIGAAAGGAIGGIIGVVAATISESRLASLSSGRSFR